MISIKNLKSSEGSGLPKVIAPGNVVCKINSIKLETPSYDTSASFLVMNVETEPLENFEGFYIDKNNPGAGRHLGQVGKVKTNEYAYKDGTTKTGIEVYRQNDILKALESLARNTNSYKWMEENDGVFETIEEYVEKFNEDAPFKDKFVMMCVGGKEYTNKEGYTNHDLFLVRNQRGVYNMAPVENAANVIAFDKDLHIKKKKVENLDSFGSGNVATSSSVSGDFEL
jgi:hypothetical protein